MLRDLRHAARTLVRHPSFAIAAVLSLALGIGPTVAIFSVLDAALLNPLPYAEPDRLVAIRGTSLKTTRNPLSYRTFWTSAAVSRPSRTSRRGISRCSRSPDGCRRSA